MKLNLYLITQDTNYDYDTYDAAVVVAESEVEAKTMHPASLLRDVSTVVPPSAIEEPGKWAKYAVGRDKLFGSWTTQDNVKATLIGYTDTLEKGVVIASFHAG